MSDSVMRSFDLRNPASAYAFGFMQADGHHYAGRGRKGTVTIEIKAQDAAVLRAMQQAIPWRTSIRFRTRTTNFADCAHTAVLTMCALEGRERLLELGLPTGRKSATVAPPAEPFSHCDYLRGLYDGDGSVGFAVNGMPFLSLVTASPAIAEFTCAEILRVTGAPEPPAEQARRRIQPHDRQLPRRSLRAVALRRPCMHSPASTPPRLPSPRGHDPWECEPVALASVGHQRKTQSSCK
jgi:hypothetical protein